MGLHQRNRILMYLNYLIWSWESCKAWGNPFTDTKIRTKTSKALGNPSTVQGTRCKMHGTRYTVQCTRYKVHGIRYTAHGIRHMVLGTRYTGTVCSNTPTAGVGGLNVMTAGIGITKCHGCGYWDQMPCLRGLQNWDQPLVPRWLIPASWTVRIHLRLARRNFPAAVTG